MRHTPERDKRLGLRKTTLESRGHVQTVGLNAETKSVGTEPRGVFLLTSPLIGLVRVCCFSGPTQEYNANLEQTP